MATSTEYEQIAINLRYHYWYTLEGNSDRANQEPSAESLAAWVEVAKMADSNVRELIANRALLDLADNVAARIPASGLEDGELRRAITNFRFHRAKLSRHHGAFCVKCVRTAQRLVDAEAE